MTDIYAPSGVELGPTTKAAPAGNGGLTTTTVEESMMAKADSIHIPTTRTHKRDECGSRSPQSRICNRPAGHTGRHNFSWRHLDGRVREVWA